MKQKQYLSFSEIEEISRKCRRESGDFGAKTYQLPYEVVDRIEKRSQQLRSEAFAALFTGLFRFIGNRLSALASTTKGKPATHGHKPIGASAS